jgi:hypothetical protein
VTFDGQPVQQGSIEFVDQDGKSQSAGGVIQNGAYQAKDIPPGKKVVRITANKKVGEKQSYGPGSPMQPIYQQFLPPQFNSQSTLVRDVAGTTKLDFDLKAAQ